MQFTRASSMIEARVPFFQRKWMATMNRIGLAVLGGLFLAACGDATGPEFPSVQGAYSGAWGLELVHIASGDTYYAECPGSVTISNQSGDSFSGSFRIDATSDCDAESGSVLNGQVRADGGLNFSIDVPGSDPNAFSNMTGCVFVSGSDQFNGTLTGIRMTASASSVIDCPSDFGPQRWRITMDINGSRS